MTDPPVKKRDEALKARIRQMRENDEWHLFQDFCLLCLGHMDYRDIRASEVRSDYGKDAVAIDPDNRHCFVAVSFESTKKKVLADAKRWEQDPNREPAEVMLFMTWGRPQGTTISRWQGAVRKAVGLDLLVVQQKALIRNATHEAVWDEVCDLLGISIRRSGYTRIAPYDAETIRERLRVRPPEILAHLLPRRELEGRDWGRNCLVFGKPGAGKTTAIFQALEHLQPEATFIVERDFSEYSQAQRLVDALAASGGVLVFDDIQERPEPFKMLCNLLPRPLPDNVLVLAAVRSTDWDEVGRIVPHTCFDELGMTDEGVLALGDLTPDECRDLVLLCREQWDLVMDDRLVGLAAKSAAAGDASPLYVISLLAPVRGREDRTVADADVAGVPRGVVDLWRGYFDRLGPAERTVLRLVKLFWAARTEPQRPLLDAAAGRLGLAVYQVDDALDRLERVLWITRPAGAPSCLDVQLEAIPLSSDDFDRWDAFVREFAGARDTHLNLLNGTGCYYAQVRRPGAAAQDEYRRAIESGIRHFEQALSLSRDDEERSMFLNNASAPYSDLAALETTREGRRDLLQKAVAYVEEAITVRRGLGLQAEVAMSLNNASNYYSDLAARETTRQGRRDRLQKAVEYVEEAVTLYRGLGLPANVAVCLNNASGCYSDLAALETTREGRRDRLQKAVTCVEEAITIRRGLGLQANVAASLNNASLRYSDLAALETMREGRRNLLQKAVTCVEEAIDLYRGLGLQADVAASLNNASPCYSDLAALETTREGRRDRLQKAVAYVEEAVTLYRGLGLQANVATSLNNASALYSDLAALETTREGRRDLLQKAITYVEEAIDLYRGLGLQADMATSLNNASNLYSELSALETTREGRRDRLQKAVAYVEEAITIRRGLGLQADVATSLNNASGCYNDLAALETTREGRRDLLQKAVTCVEEAVTLYRGLGLQADVAMSLNNASGCYSDLAALKDAPDERLALREKALAASQEAIDIFREAGNPVRFLIALTNGVKHIVALAAETHEAVDEGLIGLCDEGIQVATEYGDADRAEWFAAVKAAIERGEIPDL